MAREIEMKVNKTFKETISNLILVVFMASVLFTGCSDTAVSSNIENASSEEIINSQETEENTELEAAYELNNEVVGWLTVDGCEIDNRIFQAADNDKYLRVDEEGNSDVWGCYFLDYINIIEDGSRLTDKISIIYGHSLEDTSESEKFSKLKRYRDTSFAEQHSTIEFELLNGKTQWQIFSACQTPITIDYIDPNPDTEKYQSILNYMLENSYADFGVDVSTNDQILVLSTCTSDENVRFIVAAKLIKQ